MQAALRTLHELHGDVELTGGIRIFAQLGQLEACTELARVLGMEHFHPRVVTITLRHTDWRWWEFDSPLHIASRWVNMCTFPESVQEIRLELESLARRKEQVDSIAEQMCEKWCFFRRNASLLLRAQIEATIVERWTVSSTWEGKRWVEDEIEGKEGVLDYYVKTVVFRPASERRQTDADRRCPRLEAPLVGMRDSRGSPRPRRAQYVP
ncbi:MAG: hypothetical protein Q9159_003248 [Coniocarpon cinnabarinum]